VISVRGTQGAFSVACDCGTVFQARRVVLALGRRGTPRKLGVPGEALPKVMYQLLDAESYHGQRLLVVGGGDSAVEAALGLARQGDNEVTLSYRREKLVRVKKKNEERFQTLVAERRLRTLFDSEVTEILPARVRLVVGRSAPAPLELRNDYVFVFAGGEPPFALVKRMGVRFGGGAAPAPKAPSVAP
jgi:thioredoxin reductase